MDRGDEYQSSMEADCDQHEKAKESELYEQSNYNDVGPHLKC